MKIDMVALTQADPGILEKMGIVCDNGIPHFVLKKEKPVPIGMVRLSFGVLLPELSRC